MRQISPGEFRVKRGVNVIFPVDLDGSESLVLDVSGCDANITVCKPDGSISLYLEYPDTALTPLLAGITYSRKIYRNLSMKLALKSG